MNDADSAPSPNRVCRKLGILKAAANASAASLRRPKQWETTRCRISPVIRLTRIPAATRNAPLVNILVGRGLAERAVRLLHQVGLDERVDVAVEDARDVADRLLGPVILGQLIGMQHVAADLAAEADFLF